MAAGQFDAGAGLRVVTGARPGDPLLSGLVAALSAVSAEFGEIWSRQEVAVHRTTRKVLEHPAVGVLDLQCDVVLSPPSGQRLVLFRPQPGTGTAEQLEMLAVLGTQSFTG